jgi:hypothetical protein
LAGRVGPKPPVELGGGVTGLSMNTELADSPPHPDPLPASGEREKCDLV